jgi:hypothetical protein
MIFGTYLLAGVVLLISAYLFKEEALTATTHTLFWCISFFFASADASSAYLTVSEIFPLEVPGQAISYFFAISQIVGSMGAVEQSLSVGRLHRRERRGDIFEAFALGVDSEEPSHDTPENSHSPRFHDRPTREPEPWQSLGCWNRLGCSFANRR